MGSMISDETDDDKMLDSAYPAYDMSQYGGITTDRTPLGYGRMTNGREEKLNTDFARDDKGEWTRTSTSGKKMVRGYDGSWYEDAPATAFANTPWPDP